eukprot:scaffold3941_cov201-Alexandrium_tamarense.AAC.31
MEDPYCATLPANANLTNYGRTTIANVLYIASEEAQATGFFTLDKKQYQIFTKFFWADQSLPHLIRLYIISVCTWIITYYTLKNIKREWRENLVLRRVYYLESDHYGNRQSELDKTVFLPHADDTDEEGSDDDDGVDLRRRRAINRGLTKPKYKTRQPWIPHPEHRDTIPNIELYSVLVGGLPSLPNEVVNSEDMQTAIGISKRASIDWQLAVATTFFDHCVPNQPGFSSSVVAVTILPGAPELAKAWRKWYAAAAALRRLRFIRQVINSKRHYDIDDVEVDEESQPSMNATIPVDFHESQTPTLDMPQCKPKVTFLDDDTASQRFQDAETNRQVAEYRKTYGASHNPSDIDYRIFRSLNYGPEQQAVYSREMAQGAAACCPNGCCEGRVRRQPIDRLMEMEEATIDRLENAQYQLQCAQMQAAVSIVDKGDAKSKYQSTQDTEFMLQDAERMLSRSAHSPQRTPSKSIYVGEGITKTPSSEGVELPSLDSVFSGDGDDSMIDVAPKTPDFFSDDLSDHSGDGTPQPKQVIPGSSDKKLAMETELLSKFGPALPSFNQSAAKLSPMRDNVPDKSHITPETKAAALQTINEDADGSHFVSPLRNGIASPTNSAFLPPPSTRSTTLRMTSEGKFLFNSATYDDEEMSMVSGLNNNTVAGGVVSECDVHSSAGTSLRKRALTGQSYRSEAEVSRSSNQWEQVNNILRKDDEGQQEVSQSNREIETGVWTMPSCKSSVSSVKSFFIGSLKAVGRWTKVKTDPLTSKLAKDSTYAVVTFSSRQAAVAARHCLADGRGVHRWLSVETIPV